MIIMEGLDMIGRRSDMEKAYVFLADGFEEVEGLTVVDILRRGNIDTVTVSITDKRDILGSHNIPVKADACFDDTDFSDGTLFVLPGGMPGTQYLGEHKGLCDLLIAKKAEGKRLAAICAAPSVLGDLGLLKGEKAACFPGRESRLTGAEVLYDEVVVSGQITTSRGMGTAIPFGLSLIAQLKSQEEADALGKSIIYRVS